ncbi:MAG TPA: hypothetical protein VIK14_08055 [Ignavibacteria bacterium]
MRKIITILVSAYFTGGTMILPLGDFTTLLDIPAMYKNCKETEQEDMTPIDFITDHLLNFDCLFDEHPPGDKQRPHKPFVYHHNIIQVVLNNIESGNLTGYFPPKEISYNYSFGNNYKNNYKNKIFHPPRVYDTIT